MRTEGDTWDIVSSVGRTALAVAAFRGMETASPDPLIHDEYAAMFVHAAGDQAFVELLANASESPFGKRFPGFNMGLRTRFFDEFFLDAASAGAKQAVILASGLDARAYRLSWPTGTTVYEIDQSKVLEFKDQVLADNAVKPTTTLREVAVDLRDDWPAALRAAGFDPSVPTAWSAEGLLMFLPAAAQDAMFERITELSAPGSSVALESFASGTDMRRFTQTQKEYFANTSLGFEDFDPTELFFDDQRGDPRQWFLDNGWSLRSFGLEQLADRYGRGLPEQQPPEDFPPAVSAFWHIPRYSIATTA